MKKYKTFVNEFNDYSDGALRGMAANDMANQFAKDGTFVAADWLSIPQKELKAAIRMLDKNHDGSVGTALIHKIKAAKKAK